MALRLGSDAPGSRLLDTALRMLGRLLAEQDRRPPTVYAVHLTNRLTVAQRARQLAPVLAHADRQTTPVILAGDFNTSPFTWVGHVLPVPTGTQDDRLEALVRAHGFRESDVLDLLHKAEDISRCAAAKAVVKLPRGVNGKRRRLFGAPRL